jgi:hypothetical protein
MAEENNNGIKRQKMESTDHDRGLEKETTEKNLDIQTWCSAIFLLQNGVNARMDMEKLMGEDRIKNNIQLYPFEHMKVLMNSSEKGAEKRAEVKKYLSIITTALKTSLKVSNERDLYVYFGLWEFYAIHFGSWYSKPNNDKEFGHQRVDSAYPEPLGFYSLSYQEYEGGMELWNRVKNM